METDGTTPPRSNRWRRIDMESIILEMMSGDPAKLVHLERIKQQLATAINHTPNHPVYAVMIEEAISSLNEEGGSTVDAISNFIVGHYDVLPIVHAPKLVEQLDLLVRKEEILFTLENRYVLPSDDVETLAAWKREIKKNMANKRSAQTKSKDSRNKRSAQIESKHGRNKRSDDGRNKRSAQTESKDDRNKRSARIVSKDSRNKRSAQTESKHRRNKRCKVEKGASLQAEGNNVALPVDDEAEIELLSEAPTLESETNAFEEGTGVLEDGGRQGWSGMCEETYENELKGSEASQIEGHCKEQVEVSVKMTAGPEGQLGFVEGNGRENSAKGVDDQRHLMLFQANIKGTEVTVAQSELQEHLIEVLENLVEDECQVEVNEDLLEVDHIENTETEVTVQPEVQQSLHVEQHLEECHEVIQGGECNQLENGAEKQGDNECHPKVAEKVCEVVHTEIKAIGRETQTQVLENLDMMENSEEKLEVVEEERCDQHLDVAENRAEDECLHEVNEELCEADCTGNAETQPHIQQGIYLMEHSTRYTLNEVTEEECNRRDKVTGEFCEERLEIIEGGECDQDGKEVRDQILVEEIQAPDMETEASEEQCQLQQAASEVLEAELVDECQVKVTEELRTVELPEIDSVTRHKVEESMSVEEGLESEHTDMQAIGLQGKLQRLEAIVTEEQSMQHEHSKAGKEAAHLSEAPTLEFEANALEEGTEVLEEQRQEAMEQSREEDGGMQGWSGMCEGTCENELKGSEASQVEGFVREAHCKEQFEVSVKMTAEPEGQLGFVEGDGCENSDKGLDDQIPLMLFQANIKGAEVTVEQSELQEHLVEIIENRVEDECQVEVNEELREVDHIKHTETEGTAQPEVQRSLYLQQRLEEWHEGIQRSECNELEKGGENQGDSECHPEVAEKLCELIRTEIKAIGCETQSQTQVLESVENSEEKLEVVEEERCDQQLDGAGNQVEDECLGEVTKVGHHGKNEGKSQPLLQQSFHAEKKEEWVEVIEAEQSDDQEKHQIEDECLHEVTEELCEADCKGNAETERETQPHIQQSVHLIEHSVERVEVIEEERNQHDKVTEELCEVDHRESTESERKSKPKVQQSFHVEEQFEEPLEIVEGRQCDQYGKGVGDQILVEEIQAPDMETEASEKQCQLQQAALEVLEPEPVDECQVKVIEELRTVELPENAEIDSETRHKDKESMPVEEGSELEHTDTQAIAVQGEMERLEATVSEEQSTQQEHHSNSGIEAGHLRCDELELFAQNAGHDAATSSCPSCQKSYSHYGSLLLPLKDKFVKLWRRAKEDEQELRQIISFISSMEMQKSNSSEPMMTGVPTEPSSDLKILSHSVDVPTESVRFTEGQQVEFPNCKGILEVEKMGFESVRISSNLLSRCSEQLHTEKHQPNHLKTIVEHVQCVEQDGLSDLTRVEVAIENNFPSVEQEMTTSAHTAINSDLVRPEKRQKLSETTRMHNAEVPNEESFPPLFELGSKQLSQQLLQQLDLPSKEKKLESMAMKFQDHQHMMGYSEPLAPMNEGERSFSMRNNISGELPRRGLRPRVKEVDYCDSRKNRRSLLVPNESCAHSSPKTATHLVQDQHHSPCLELSSQANPSSDGTTSILPPLWYQYHIAQLDQSHHSRRGRPPKRKSNADQGQCSEKQGTPQKVMNERVTLDHQSLDCDTEKRRGRPPKP